MLTPVYLFGNEPEMIAITKSYSVASEKYKDLTLENLKSHILDEIKTLPPTIQSGLEDCKARFKRASGLFNAWVPCFVHITKDKFDFLRGRMRMNQSWQVFVRI